MSHQLLVAVVLLSACCILLVDAKASGSGSKKRREKDENPPPAGPNSIAELEELLKRLRREHGEKREEEVVVKTEEVDEEEAERQARIQAMDDIYVGLEDLESIDPQLTFRAYHLDHLEKMIQKGGNKSDTNELGEDFSKTCFDCLKQNMSGHYVKAWTLC